MPRYLLQSLTYSTKAHAAIATLERLKKKKKTGLPLFQVCSENCYLNETLM